ncbi:WD domain [Trypanosoma vivax]|uniref:Putative chromatin assembly factor 1 subunit B n=1 Tax=Trypanosoma vivax (strain Y486) TaxID=1055687 RepID=G0U6Z4_TRYVY|nr:WD domain [Trypanosoma vivax]CCC51651.1 putative chromatin assembly factor 1 subunit B [Trypanosoma vivax Y486]
MSSPGQLLIRVRTLEILWHGCERDEEAVQFGLQSVAIEGIVSIDYNAQNDRIVTSGGDGHIRLWQLHPEAIGNWLVNSQCDMTACATFICGMRSAWMPLTARWSPNGRLIASAHCDGKICLWWKERNQRDDGEEEWKDYRHLSGHVIDVYDICFSPDSRYLLSAGGDGSVVLHDLDGSTVPVVQLQELHRKFCRGVAWDPWMQFVATFGGGPPLVFMHAPKPGARRPHLLSHRKGQGDFIGESCAATFRRIGWSPDGTILAVPYGKVVHDNSSRSHGDCENGVSAAAKDARRANDMVHCVYFYTRNALDKVAGRMIIRGYSEVRGVLWAPCFLQPIENSIQSLVKIDDEKQEEVHEERVDWEKRKRALNDRGSWGPEDYRMALAVWTAEEVIVYTTDSAVRHSDYTDLHMRSISDVAWSPDAAYLFTASLDGYISVISTGGSLGIAHKLPLFSDRPVTIKLAQMLVELKKASEKTEIRRGEGGSPSNQKAPPLGRDGGGSATVMHAPVKKKRKTEQHQENAKEDLKNLEPSAVVTITELTDLMDGV